MGVRVGVTVGFPSDLAGPGFVPLNEVVPIGVAATGVAVSFGAFSEWTPSFLLLGMGVGMSSSPGSRSPVSEASSVMSISFPVLAVAAGVLVCAGASCKPSLTVVCSLDGVRVFPAKSVATAGGNDAIDGDRFTSGVSVAAGVAGDGAV